MKVKECEMGSAGRKVHLARKPDTRKMPDPHEQPLETDVGPRGFRSFPNEPVITEPIPFADTTSYSLTKSSVSKSSKATFRLEKEEFGN